jgi:amino acid transporter
MTGAERSVQAHSAVLKKELGLWNLVFTQILFVMGLSWVGTAAKLGSSHVVFWLLAVVLFYVPSAVVVVHLSRKMPLEGGLYQWAKLGISDRMGFLTAWNLWIYAMVLMSENGVTAATNIAYAFHEDWIAENKWCITLATLVIIGGLAWLSVVGLGAGKWLHGGAGLMMVIIVGAMIALPIVPWLHGVKPQSTPFALTMPALTVLNLNILGKLGFGALGGVEYVAIFAGETRDPARLIARSVYIAAPVIAVLFILGTGAGAGVHPAKSNRSGVAGLASAERGDAAVWDCRERGGRYYYGGARVEDRADQREFCGDRAAPDGGGLGSFAAEVVHEIASEIPDAGAVDCVRGRGDDAARDRGDCRNWPGGSVPTAK